VKSAPWNPPGSILEGFYGATAKSSTTFDPL
jgi:hypothetical protein